MRKGSRYAFLFDNLYAVTLCGTFFSVMNFIALLCWCLREASRKEGVPNNASCRAACNIVFGNSFSKRLKARGCFILQSISGIGNKKSWFSQKRTSFWLK